MRSVPNMQSGSIHCERTGIYCFARCCWVTRVSMRSFPSSWRCVTEKFGYPLLLMILLQEFTGGTVGFVASTLLILILGEITRKLRIIFESLVTDNVFTAQAACSRYALFIGYHVVPLVKLIVCLMYPFSKPLSMALDYVLGQVSVFPR